MWNNVLSPTTVKHSIASRRKPTERSDRPATATPLTDSPHSKAMMWKQYPTNRKLRPHDINHLMAVAKVAAESQLADSRLLTNGQWELPKFGHDEIKLGRFLGKGGFCTVHEISKVILDDDADTTAATLMDTSTSQNVPGYDLYLVNDSPHQQPLFSSSRRMNIEVSAKRTSTVRPPEEPRQNRAFMGSQYRRRGRKKGCRYALKRVTVNKSMDAGTLLYAVVDLAVEAKFLAVLRHPNIIKMRGTAASCPFSSEDTYFIVLDRLYEILRQRLLRWRNQKHSYVEKLMTCHQKNRETLFWVERLKVARDIASALTYLHGRSIVYRDLKPENIGFDVRGDVKIFDFGLAKEFNRTQCDVNGTYKFTGATGSQLYMAPEVALSNPYNESADVYSFTILLWEVLQLQTPFEGYTSKKFHERVVCNGIRPKCDPEWPSVLLNLIRHGWSAKIRKRPTMSFFTSALRVQINQNEQVLPSVPGLGTSSMFAREESFDDCASKKSELSYLRSQDD